MRGSERRRILSIREEDIIRVGKAIEEAKWAADEVIISLHNHQIVDGDKEKIPEFIRKFSHFCIDSGATAVIGHGPHLLRGIEVYKDRPIFYSLGDFVLRLYDVEFAPDESYQRYGVDSRESIYELLKTRSKGFTVGLMEDPKMSETVIRTGKRKTEG